MVDGVMVFAQRGSKSWVWTVYNDQWRQLRQCSGEIHSKQQN